jgi:hypothetical protein
MEGNIMYNGNVIDAATPYTSRNRRHRGFCDGDHAGLYTVHNIGRAGSDTRDLKLLVTQRRVVVQRRASVIPTPLDFRGTEDLLRATKGASK